jgi:hydrogenase expression/formation protein HypC
MCLGIPGRVLEISRDREVLMGLVDFGGIRRKVCLEHVPETCTGEYVLVHVGFALARIDAEEARRVLSLLEGTDELETLEVPSA